MGRHRHYVDIDEVISKPIGIMIYVQIYADGSADLCAVAYIYFTILAPIG